MTAVSTTMKTKNDRSFTRSARVPDTIEAAEAMNTISPAAPRPCRYAADSGVKPDGEYWVFLEMNEGSYGGRPASDGPDSIDSLMANTRNNPLEDLTVRRPMICDRYELRHAALPRPGGETWPAVNRRRIADPYQRIVPRSITPCSASAFAASRRVASRPISKPGPPRRAEVRRQPSR